MRLHLSLTTWWSLFFLYYFIWTSTGNPTHQIKTTTTTPKPNGETLKLKNATQTTTPTIVPSTTQTAGNTESTTTEPPVEGKPFLTEKEKDLLHLIKNLGFLNTVDILERRVAHSIRANLTDEDRSKIRANLLTALHDFHVMQIGNSTISGPPINKLYTFTRRPSTTTSKTTTAITPQMEEESQDGAAEELEDLSDETENEQLKKRSIVSNSNSKLLDAFPETPEDLPRQHKHGKGHVHGHGHLPIMASTFTRESTALTTHGLQGHVDRQEMHSESMKHTPTHSNSPLSTKFVSRPPAAAPVSILLINRPNSPNPTVRPIIAVWTTTAPLKTSTTTETQAINKTENEKTAKGKCPTFAGFVSTAKELWQKLLKANGWVSSLSLVLDAWIQSMKSLGICFLGLGSNIWNYFYGLFTSG